MTKLLSYGCATWLLTLGVVHAQPSSITTASVSAVATPAATKPSEARLPIWQAQPVSNRPMVSEALQVQDPVVLTTAKLQNGGQVITLAGIEGLDGYAAQGFRTYLNGQRMTCQSAGNDEFDCALSDGTNVAEAALINGAARAKPDASEAYRADEAKAQAARRGLWSDISLLPSVSVLHPTVQDTATLVSDQTTVSLEGIQGLGEPYAGQLQSFVNSSGEHAVCLPQSAPGRFVCTTNDGTDIAKVALVNGAATVMPTASDAYRAQQADAVANRRGIWAEQPVAEPAYAAGVTYVSGEPRAWIDGSFVSLAYVDGAWGYHDYYHHWHLAPAAFVAHMDHYHPGGHGLGGGRGSGSHQTASAGHAGSGSHASGGSSQSGASSKASGGGASKSGASQSAKGGGSRGGTSHAAMGGGSRSGATHTAMGGGSRSGATHTAMGGGSRGGMTHTAMSRGNMGGMSHASMGGGSRGGMGRSASMGHAGGGTRMASAHTGGGGRRR